MKQLEACIQDWSTAVILELFEKPLLELIFQASKVHRDHHDSRSVQLNKLISVKTGGCPEDCAYCPQSARYKTDLKKTPLMSVLEVAKIAEQAKAKGVSRLCLGAAWRDIPHEREFQNVLRMVELVAGTGLEVCCTMGKLTADQAFRLKEAGLTAYNHNLDTSPEYYKKIIHTRTYADRLQTIAHVQAAQVSVCCGGIIGMGETIEDRAELIFQLTCLLPQLESIPINALMPIQGTPLSGQTPVAAWDVVRMIAVTRIVLPKPMIRISAGRNRLSDSDQALCFLAGANSIFYDDRLLTAPNPTADQDDILLQKLGLIRGAGTSHA